MKISSLQLDKDKIADEEANSNKNKKMANVQLIPHPLLFPKRRGVRLRPLSSQERGWGELEVTALILKNKIPKSKHQIINKYQ